MIENHKTDNVFEPMEWQEEAEGRPRRARMHGMRKAVTVLGLIIGLPGFAMIQVADGSEHSGLSCELLTENECAAYRTRLRDSQGTRELERVREEHARLIEEREVICPCVMSYLAIDND